MIAGIVLFLGIHLVPAMPALRDRMIARFGPNGYKGGFSLVSLAGLILIVVGYARANPGAQLFPPLPLAVSLAPFAMIVAFILFAAANMPTHLRATLKHPMLTGLMIWSAVHLLANGDARGTLLFGAVLAYAVIDLVSAVRRHAVKTFVPRVRADVISVVAGTMVALLVMTFHRVLFGPAVVSFGI